MTLLLSIQGAGDNWATAAWKERFQRRLPDKKVVLAGQDQFDPALVRFAAVWKPTPGLLASLPNLKVIFNLGAGVDALLADQTLPDVPLVRAVSRDLTQRMTEYVTLHVLLHHRRLPMLQAAQRERVWMARDQWAAGDVRVGVMGLGELGRDASEVLLRLGFRVNGWSRGPRDVAGVTSFHGDDGLKAFLMVTDILVVLLPLTTETRGILNRGLFQQLARDGVLGAPVLINAGRGGLQVETDIISCLDDGTLGAVTLDVFETEPLPAASALWGHPGVLLTPHNAADSDPGAISDLIVKQLLAYERGEPLMNVVKRATGY
ncbi:MAG: glyoxylate/hydroxypyruvate reductase A [Hyphomicrobiaceae bacterium]|nr:glyoxylate/hydroxypyruvate reductase A [Hyphomicrobiaceae bacterium]